MKGYELYNVWWKSCETVTHGKIFCLRCWWQRHRHTYNCYDTFKRKLNPPSEEVTSLEVHTLRGREEIERGRNAERRRKRRQNWNHCTYLFQVNEYMISLPIKKFTSYEETKFLYRNVKRFVSKEKYCAFWNSFVAGRVGDHVTV